MNRVEDIGQVLHRMIDAQRYAVLATDDKGQPYTSLMAFAVTGDLKQIVLLTERATQKFANLKCNQRVAVLIDNRENSGTDTQDAFAITAIGKAREVSADACASLLGLFLARHPYLERFAASQTCAILSVNVETYVLVTRFQDVVEWHPES